MAICPVCGESFQRLDRHLARHAGTGTTAAAQRALRETPPPGIREPHDCIPGGCEFVLRMGPNRPRGGPDEPPMRGDAWAAMSAADKLATRFGSLEAAERAWRAHRPMLAAVDRDVLATAARAGRREQAAPPFAHRVFQPDTPWPPPEPGP